MSKFTDVADNLNLWPTVECGLSGTLFLGQQEQLLSWKQIDTYNYFHCRYVRTIILFFFKMVVASSAGAQLCLIAASIHRHWGSGS